MKTSLKGRVFIARHEAVVPVPYDDGIGVPTQGIGHTFRAGAPHVKWGGPRWSLKECFRVFENDLGQYEAPVNEALKASGRQVPQHVFDALVSFCFNVGPGNFNKSSVRGYLVAGRSIDAAASRLALWNKGGGRVLSGLVKRRADESRLMRTGAYGDVSKITVYSRVDGRNRPIAPKQVSTANLFAGAGEAPKPSVPPVAPRPSAPKRTKPHQRAPKVYQLGERMLERGAKGEDVKAWQEMLRAFGRETTVDGNFGPETERHTVGTQGALGVDPDGRVGVKTLAAMRRHLASRTGSKPDQETPASTSKDTETAPAQASQKRLTGLVGTVFAIIAATLVAILANGE